jgi:hypothetical protein
MTEISKVCRVCDGTGRVKVTSLVFGKELELGDFVCDVCGGIGVEDWIMLILNKQSQWDLAYKVGRGHYQI